MYRFKKRPRLARPISLADVLDSSPQLARLGLRDSEHQLDILTRWESAVGQAVARNTQPIRFAHGVLDIAVSSPAWMHNLAMLKPQILATLEREVGCGIVREIRFKVSDFDLGGIKKIKIP